MQVDSLYINYAVDFLSFFGSFMLTSILFFISHIVCVLNSAGFLVITCLMFTYFSVISRCSCGILVLCVIERNCDFLHIQEVDRARAEVQMHSSNIDDLKKQLATLEDTLLRTDQQHRRCNKSTKRLKQKLSAAKAQLERLSAERHSLLVYAVVLYTLFC